MQEKLTRTLAAIRPVNKELAAPAKTHLDGLTKPPGSLGRLEELATRIYMIQESETLAPYPAMMYTIAGDHGVNAEGVSPFPQEVTRQMVLNFANGGAGINVLTRMGGIDLKVVDAGVCGEKFPEHPDIIQRKVRPGTDNMAQGPAMSQEDCLKALCLGIDLAHEAREAGYRSLGTGEMGISNTTPSTALYCAFLGCDPVDITGPGAGLKAEAIQHKITVIARSLEVNAEAVRSKDPLKILAAVGGLEIAALAGLILGGAANRMPVAVDGFISTAAFITARAFCPDVMDYCFISHQSAEPGYSAITSAVGQRPLLDLDFRLGEGTGAAIALYLLKCAAGIWNDMASFADAGVSGG
ncbi:MAG: nicotinate-nucleotide--dimethylbenzimidazole phosphoribosyltransferase [Desulfovibrio sp.]|uniref:nicotinate-nucleotide--dimethylbenzimidazole phosphoribosyltransferase n=1 Tax=Desulfovibrio sp. 7SRBS1 TaxID=3378064 RepID=UPI003B3DAA78